jgi:hypothetical protein
MCEGLLKAKAAIMAMGLSVVEKDELRRIVLYGSSPEHEFKSQVGEDVHNHLVRLSSGITDISIQITQLPFFREQINNIFTLLISCHANESSGNGEC